MAPKPIRMTNCDLADNLARMELTHDDVKRILEIIDRAEHLDEIELVFGGFHLRVRRGNARAERSMGSAIPVASALPTEAPKPSVASAVRNEPSLNEPGLAEERSRSGRRCWARFTARRRRDSHPSLRQGSMSKPTILFA